MKFTKAAVDRFKIEAGRSEHIEFDDMMPGFGLRIRAGDKKQHRTFIAQYKIGSKHRRMTLGNVAKVTLEAAKHQAKIIFGKVAEGKDPANEKADARQVASHTLGATLAKYLEAKVASMKPRSYEETKRHLENHWKPLHGLALASIGRANVAAQVSTIAKENGPVAANRSRASLSAFFRWAIGEGLCDHNPVAGTNKEEESGPRERSLSDAETAAVWLVAPDNDYGRIVQLILLTGCRRDEIGSLQWPEIDLKEKTIKLPGERTKNKQPHTVPLSDMMAVAILPQTAPAASRAGAPTIRIEEPDITRLVRSPVNIRIRFQAAANAKIDVNTLRVRYGRLGIDLTIRILAQCKANSVWCVRRRRRTSPRSA